MAPAATTELNDRYPAPFPNDVQTIELQKITIKQLLDFGGDGTSQRLFDILSAEGFFYLDLNSPGQGQEFLEAANELHDAAKHVFNDISVEEKETYLGDPFKGELDKGYRALAKDDEGRPRVAEVLNVPINDLLNDASFQLPPWLAKYQSAYHTFAQHASNIGQALLHHLEAPLGLAPDTLASLHSISKTTGGFVRAFRYPAASPETAPSSDPTSPPHTDGNSITILFNWQGGLQIARPKQTSTPKVTVSGEGEEWLWVKPLPGFALINIGDPLVVFTNGLLRSGLHRVVRPPGEQGKFNRYSVLAGLRPKRETKMRALESEIISRKANGDAKEDGEELTAHEWAVKKVTDIIKRSQQFR